MKLKMRCFLTFFECGLKAEEISEITLSFQFHLLINLLGNLKLKFSLDQHYSLTREQES